jgi:alpha-glucosidase
VTAQRQWWQDAVIYQIYPRSFADSNGDGIGDLRGITAHLGYLADTLGVDAVWLSPIYPSPQVDFGYDVSDFTGIDPTFGTLGDFDDLIREAHTRDLRIIIDFVPNHTSDQHPWFVESRSSRTNPKRNWYVWADPAADGGPPSNWTSEQGGSTWEYDKATGQYYLHSFAVSMPDLNWRNPDLRAAMLDVLRFWLHRGVDGIRIDVAHLIAKDPDFTDNPEVPHPTTNPADRQHPDYDTQLHVNDRLHPDLHAYLREMRSLLDRIGQETNRPRVAIGEIEVLPWDRWSMFFGAQLDELHLPFNFHIIEAEWTADGLRDSIAAQEAALPAGAWPNYVLSNHDRPRLITRHGPHSARLGLLLLLTVRGTPTLYYGDELALPDLQLPPSMWRDPLGRDQSRAPMPWRPGGDRGFCPDGGAPPWLPASPGDDVATQLADPHSTLNLTRQLLRLRRDRPELQSGAMTLMTGIPNGCLGYTRRGPDGTSVIVMNFTGKSVEVTLPDRHRLLLSTHSGNSQAPTQHRLKLRPFEGVIAEFLTEKEGQ